MQSSPQPDPFVLEVFRSVVRHKVKAVLLFLGVVTLAVVVSILTPREYRSEARLFLRLGRENSTVDPTATLGKDAVVAVPHSRENEISSVVELLGGRALAEKVVDAVGPGVVLAVEQESPGGATSASLAARAWQAGLQARQAFSDLLASWRLRTPLPEREEAVVELRDRLGVRRVGKTDLISASYYAPSPQLAQTIVKQLTDLYLIEHARINRTSGAHEFLAGQMAELHEKLTRDQEELRDLKSRTGIAAPAAQVETIVANISRLKDELATKEAAIAAADARVRQWRQILDSQPGTEVVSRTTGVGNEGTDAMRAQLYALQIAREKAAANYTEAHPLYRQINEQVAKTRDILDREEPVREHVTTAQGKVFEQARLAIASEEPMLAALRVEATSLTSQLAAARSELEAFNRDELRVAELQRSVDQQLVAYQEYSRSLEQTRIDQALEDQRISNISIAQPATLEIKPVRPQVKVNLLIGLLVGLAGAVGLPLGLDYLQSNLRTAEDVERALEVPVLLSVPRWKPKQIVPNGRS